MAKKKSKIIQVPVPEGLLYQLDELSHSMGESRSHVIREACATYIASAEEAELDRQYAESYKKIPQTDEERAWLDFGLQQLTRFYQEEEESGE